MSRFLAALALGCTLTLGASAQTLIFVIAKVQDYTQTDVGTTSFNAGIGHTFNAEVIDGGYSPSLSSSFPSTAPSVDDNSSVNENLAWDTDTNSWRFEDGNYASASALDLVYADTTYDFNYNDGTTSGTGSVTFTADAYPNVPEATTTAGSWSGGSLVMDVADAFTLSTNTFSTNYSGGFGDRVSIFINGPGFSDSAEVAGSDSTSLMVSAFSLTAGHTYDVELNFTNSFASDDLTGDATDDTYASYVTITTFTITAVPEPGSWALMMGLGALGLVGTRRRR